MIDARQAKKFAKVEEELIAQEKRNLSKAKSICKDMQKEANKALDDIHWYNVGKTAKQRANALSGAFRHNRAANRLEQKYLELVAESKELRKAFNNSVDAWRVARDKIFDARDSIIGSGLNLRDLLNAINEQEICA